MESLLGYKFTFPFLSVDCGLAVDDGFTVHPLYKHLINIKRPTMAIVGLQICAYTFMYDLQVPFRIQIIWIVISYCFVFNAFFFFK